MKLTNFPVDGKYGKFGGRFVPEVLMEAISELEVAYEKARKDPSFQKQLDYYLSEFVGRPTPLYFADVGVVRDITDRKAFERQLVELANTDSLTGILSRRAFLQQAQGLCQLAQRHRRPLSCLVLDADHFKKVNDTYGHHVGDAVLARLVELTLGCLRVTDKFGRIGGEEFAIMLPESDRDHAVGVAERLLNSVRAAEITTEDGKALKFTVPCNPGRREWQWQPVSR